MENIEEKFNMAYYGKHNVTLHQTDKNRLEKFSKKFLSKLPSIYEREYAIIDIKPIKKIGNYKVFDGVVAMFIADEVARACYLLESKIISDTFNNVIYIKTLGLAQNIEVANQKINSNEFLELKSENEVKLPKEIKHILNTLNGVEK